MPTPYAVSSDLVSAWPAKSLAVATYLDGALAAKSPSASPTFTGTVTLTGATVVGFASGLVLLNKTDVSAASSVSINSVFSATYSGYLIEIGLTAASAANATLLMRLRVGGADAATLYKGGRMYQQATSVLGLDTGSTDWFVGYPSNANPNSYAALHLYGPFATAPTALSGTWINASSGGTFYNSVAGGLHTAATSYTGYSLFLDTGTFSGTVRTYGLQAS